jgi:hypothetical protein
LGYGSCLGVARSYFEPHELWADFVVGTPMRNLLVGAGLGSVLEVDPLSLTVWSIGRWGRRTPIVYGVFGHELAPSDSVF